eukprot:gene26074-34681_t
MSFALMKNKILSFITSTNSITLFLIGFPCWTGYISATSPIFREFLAELPPLQQQLVKARISIIAVRDSLLSLVGNGCAGWGRDWTNGVDYGYIACDEDGISKRLQHHNHLPGCVYENAVEANYTGSAFNHVVVVTNFNVHELSHSMSLKEIDGHLYKSWHHYNGLVQLTKRNGQRLTRILVTGIPLNGSREQLNFIKLFNERTKIILVEDENGGFQLVDAFFIAMNVLQCARSQCPQPVNESNFTGRNIATCDEPVVTADIVPAVRDEILKIILDQNITSKTSQDNGSGGEKRKESRNNATFPCVTNRAQFVTYASSSNGLSNGNWPLDKLVSCPEEITSSVNDLSPKYPLYKTRIPVAGEWPPVVHTAAVFSLAKPEYTIVTPMFNVEGHAARNIYATMKATTGIWALDIVLDTCVDDTLRIVYGAILKIIASRDNDAIHRNMCQQLCADPSSSGSSSPSSACTSADSSVLTRIRVITSKTTLLETRAENIAFSSTDSTRFFLSVQADQLVSEIGWNFFLSVPAILWEEVSAVGSRQALNVPYRDWVGTENLTTPLDYRSDQLRETVKDANIFIVRDNANRGPLLFNATKMIDMGFYNERDFWLEDDETEYHVRAYYKHKWITGYFPAGHTYVHRNRQDKRAHNLVRSHPDIEAMRGKVMKSLNAHCNRTYIDTFPNGFPHDNHLRMVTPAMMQQAKEMCASSMRRHSGFCNSHCRR